MSRSFRSSHPDGGATIATLVAGDLFPRDGSGALFSLHDHALNIALDGFGPLVSIVDDPRAMTVTSIAVRPSDLATLRSALNPAGPGASTENPPPAVTLVPSAGSNDDEAAMRILFSTHDTTSLEATFDLSGAERFGGRLQDPGGRATARSVSLLAKGCKEQHEPQGFSCLPAILLGTNAQPPADPFAARAFRSIGPALDSPHDSSALAAIASGLVGLGRGMTPSGDDFLVGLIAALLRARDVAAADVVQRAIRPLLARTTRAGATILEHALASRFPSYLCEVFMLIAAERVTDALRIAESHGHSSGLDALAGAVIGFVLAESRVGIQNDNS